MDQVEEIKNKIDIAAIIGEHISLSKAGRNYKALCPFHQEKTPSFVVSPELQIYKCFSCGESGDVISFLEKYEGLEFYDVLKILAGKAGVELKTPQGEKFSEKDKLIEANELAAKLYNFLLTKHKVGGEGAIYLKETRGINNDTIKKFNLGFSPDVSDTLSNFLIAKKKFTAFDLEKAGLVVRSKGRIFDRFRGRIIFPLYDHRNVCVGLAGRILPSVEEKLKGRGIGKYVNSPETPIYHKSKVLYGLNITKVDIKKAGFAIIVEGELDFLSLWQNNICNVVAIKGTALTEEQIKILSRFTNTLVLALDSDIAGDSASRRGIVIAQNLGMKVKVVKPSKKYKDPDEFVKGDPEGFKNEVTNAESVWDFIIDSIFTKNDSSSGEGKLLISREIVPVLSSIDDKIVQTHYVSKVARKLSVPSDAVWDQIKKISQKDETKVENTITDSVLVQSQPNDKSDRQEILEEKFLSLGFQLAPNQILENQALLHTPFSKKVVDELAKFVEGNDFSVKGFVDSLPKELSSRFSELILFANKEFEDETDKIKKEFDLITHEIRQLNYRKQLMELTKKISHQEEGGQGDLSELTKEFTRISKLLSDLE